MEPIIAARSSTTLRLPTGRYRLCVGATVLALGWSASLAAQESGDAAVEHGAAALHHEGIESHGEHEFHANHVAFFLGGTIPTTGESTVLATVGVDYERRFSTAWGVLGMFGRALEDHERSFTLMVAPVYHPTESLRFYVGPGIEFAEELEETEPHGATALSEESGEGKTSHAVVGFGGYGDIETSSAIISPHIAHDYSAKTRSNFIFGVAIGWGGLTIPRGSCPGR